MLFSSALLLLLLISLLLLVIWLTVPGHAAGQIIITTLDDGVTDIQRAGK